MSTITLSMIVQHNILSHIESSKKKEFYNVKVPLMENYYALL